MTIFQAKWFGDTPNLLLTGDYHYATVSFPLHMCAPISNSTRVKCMHMHMIACHAVWTMDLQSGVFEMVMYPLLNVGHIVS